MKSSSSQDVLYINDLASLCRVAVAESFFSRAGGLLVRGPLKDDEGLWIKQCGSIHTIGMRYAIDVVFLDERGCVLRVSEAVKPLRMRLHRGAASVLEMRASAAAQFGITKGCLLTTTSSQVAQVGPTPSYS